MTPAPVEVKGFVKIFDPNTNELLLDTTNAIHYENMSEAMANSLANRSVGEIYAMSFGNGGSAVDPTGVITYLPKWWKCGRSNGCYHLSTTQCHRPKCRIV